MYQNGLFQVLILTFQYLLPQKHIEILMLQQCTIDDMFILNLFASLFWTVNSD